MWKLSFECSENVAHALANAIEPLAHSISWKEVKDNEQLWEVHAFFEEKPDQTTIHNALSIAAEILQIDPPALTVKEIEDQNWLETTWRSFPPLTVGRFYIYGTHIEEEPPTNKITIELNAATAFGSGEHETTQGCLMAIEELCAQHRFATPLDMGTGSGILALALHKLLDIPIVAADNDPESIRVVNVNMQQNDCPKVIPFVSEGFDNPEVREHAPFDLIVANILAKPLCSMAKDMHTHCQNEGFVILSGLLTWQAEEVLNAYQAQGFECTDKKDINGWSTLTLKK